MKRRTQNQNSNTFVLDDECIELLRGQNSHIMGELAAKNLKILVVPIFPLKRKVGGFGGAFAQTAGATRNEIKGDFNN